MRPPGVDTLARILDGEPVEDADASVHELAGVAQLLKAAEVEVDPDFRHRLRNDLIREANTLAAARTPSPVVRLRDGFEVRLERLRYSARAASVIGVAAAVLSGGGIATASGHAVPGDLLYGVKLAIEDVRVAFAGDGISRADALWARVEVRLEEVRIAIERDDPVAAARALRLADESLREAAQLHFTAYLEEANTEPLDSLAEQARTVAAALDQLEPLLDGEAAAAAAEMRVSLERIRQRIEVFSTGACTGCDLGVHDDADAEDGDARGTEADGTPAVPGAADPLDLTYIPPAKEPFQACPCVPAPPASSSPPAAAPAGPRSEDEPTSSTGGPGAPGSGSSPGGSGGGASDDPPGSSEPEGPLPPVVDELPPQGGELLDELLDQVPSPPPDELPVPPPEAAQPSDVEPQVDGSAGVEPPAGG